VLHMYGEEFVIVALTRARGTSELEALRLQRDGRRSFQLIAER
jgi:hypothetical protein